MRRAGTRARRSSRQHRRRRQRLHASCEPSERGQDPPRTRVCQRPDRVHSESDARSRAPVLRAPRPLVWASASVADPAVTSVRLRRASGLDVPTRDALRSLRQAASGVRELRRRRVRRHQARSTVATNVERRAAALAEPRVGGGGRRDRRGRDRHRGARPRGPHRVARASVDRHPIPMHRPGRPSDRRRVPRRRHPIRRSCVASGRTRRRELPVGASHRVGYATRHPCGAPVGAALEVPRAREPARRVGGSPFDDVRPRTLR